MKKTTTGKNLHLYILLLFLLFSLGMCGQPDSSSLAYGLNLSASAPFCLAPESSARCGYMPRGYPSMGDEAMFRGDYKAL
jgi:hypothetical protein